MESRTLKREGDDLVWEATWDGCSVEVALGPSDGDDAACQVETLEFESPRTAREYVDAEIERLIGQGFELQQAEQPPPPPVEPRPRVVDLGRVFRMEPKRAENPEMLTAIQADPDDTAAYLVYADWLQEQGDPRGELMAIQHAARRSGDSSGRVAARVIVHFEDLLLPPGCDSDSVRLRWDLGFIQGARVRRYSVSISGILDHPSAQVLRELSADAKPFYATMLGGCRLPCLKILKLENVTAAKAKRLRAVLEGPHLPVLRQLSLRDVDDLGATLAHIVASGRLADLDLLDVACDEVRHDRLLRWAVKKCTEIPAARRPRLCLTVSNDDDDDKDDVSMDRDPEAMESLRQAFPFIEPDAVPSCFALEGDRRHESYEEIGEDILDRICDACGAPMEDPAYDPICPDCGHYHDYYAYDDDDDDDAPVVDDEPDLDASRPTGEDHGVDERWEAFKDDVFDIDDP